jgi:hypothetical protein
METKMIKLLKLLGSAVSLTLLASPVLATPKSGANTSVVLVHGAFVDGSGWDGVYKLLKKDGYEVIVV